MARLLELDGVGLPFGGLRVLDGLDLHVDEGEIVKVIGPNGAGKTTLFNVITGIYEPDEGDIRLGGESIVGLPSHVIARRGVARTFQSLRLFLNMSVIENVMAATYGNTHATVFESMLRLPRAASTARRGSLPRRSSLRRAARRLSLESAGVQPLVREPAAVSRSRGRWRPSRGLLFDEPAAGMNLVETHEITELIGKPATTPATRFSSSSTTCTSSRASPTAWRRSTTASRSRRASSRRWPRTSVVIEVYLGRREDAA